MSDENAFLPAPCVLKHLLTYKLDFPVVFKGQVASWNLPKSPEILDAEYGDVSLDFRLVKKSIEAVSWEGNAEFTHATISQFIHWQLGEPISSIENPFHNFKKEDYWAYSSYNYMNDLFPHDCDMLKAVSWEKFGFSEYTGKDGTCWLGSESSYTPCHYDSYGVNLVAQIFGRKKWILFPPEDSSFMYPSRVPYEESSVFSSVNIIKPDLTTHPKFKESHPYSVILEPGDVLFVPKKWWHFVVSLDDITFSINTWIKLDSDSDNHLEEAVTKALIESFISSYEPFGETWLNPKEELTESNDAIKYIISSMEEIQQKKNTKIDNPKTACKIFKTDKTSSVHSLSSQQLLNCESVFKVPEIPIVDYLCAAECSEHIKIDKCTSDITVRNIVNCFVHPEVVSLICKLLKEL